MKSMKMIKKAQAGFTLIELMIVVAIIGILAAIAIPQYNNYVSRTRASGAMAELASVKSAVSMCYQETGDFTQCDAGAFGIPTPQASGNIAAAGTVVDGVVTVTTTATDGATPPVQLTIIDTPSYTAGDATMKWDNSGTSCNATRGFKDYAGDCNP